MSVMASQVTSPTIVYSSIYSGADQSKHQSSASLAFVRGIHGWLLNSPHKGPVIWKRFPFDDVIMNKIFRSVIDKFNITRGRFKKTYELLNLRALKFSPVNKIHIFQCMGKTFCVEFQRYPLKFHTKYLTHALKDTIFIQHWNFKSSEI